MYYILGKRHELYGMVLSCQPRALVGEGSPQTI